MEENKEICESGSGNHCGLSKKCLPQCANHCGLSKKHLPQVETVVVNVSYLIQNN